MVSNFTLALAGVFVLAAIASPAHAEEARKQDGNKVTVEVGGSPLVSNAGAGAAATLRIADTKDNDEFKLTAGGIATPGGAFLPVGSLSMKIFKFDEHGTPREKTVRAFWGDNHWILSDGIHNTFGGPVLTLATILTSMGTEGEWPPVPSGAHIGSRTNFIEIELPRGVFSYDRNTGRWYGGFGAAVMAQKQLSDLWTIAAHAAYSYAWTADSGPGTTASLVSAGIGARYKAGEKLVIEPNLQVMDTLEAKGTGAAAASRGGDPVVTLGVSFQVPVL